MTYLRICFTKSVFFLLIFFGLASTVLSSNIFAAETIEEVIGFSSGMEEGVDALSNIMTDVTNYEIFAGPLNKVLDQYSKKSGVNLSYDATKIEGIQTRGVKGKFSPQNGLNFLLRGTGLQAVKQASLNPYAKKYIIQEAGAATTSKSTENVTKLPLVTVAGDVDYGYSVRETVNLTKGQDILVRDIPQQITVISKKQLSDLAPLSVTEAIRYVPGVGVSSGEGNRDAIVFRGNRTTGDFYVDGVRDDTQHFRDFYNIEKLEVIKGPNGLIFGRGGSGGIFNRVRKEANWNPKQEVRFSGGSYNHKRFSIDTGYVLNDKVAFRLNGLYQKSHSFRQGYRNQRYGIAPTVTIKPTNRTKIVIQAELFKDDRIADRGIPSEGGSPFNTRRKQFFGDPSRSPTDTNKKAVSMHIDHRFKDISPYFSKIAVRNRTQYSIFDKFYQNVFANSAVSGGSLNLGAYNDQTDRENFFNQTDLLLDFDTGPFKHKMVTGVEISRQMTDQLRQRGHVSNGTTSLSISAANPITGDPLIFFNRGTKDNNHHHTTSTAGVFIQDEIEIHPMLRATAGVRYDRFEQDSYRKDGLTGKIKSRDDNISPRFGLIFKPLEIMSIYGSYSLTHQPRSGDQLSSLTVTNASLAPEKFINIEGGIKVDIRPNLAFTTAFYQLDRTNVVLTTGAAGQSFLGKGTRVRGVEVGLNGRITDQWSFLGAYTYQEGTLKDGSSKTGNTLGELPKHTYSVWNRYDINSWFGAGFGVIGRSAAFTSTTNNVSLKPYTRVDAALYGRINKYLRAQVNIQNLFDTNYYVASHNDNNIMPGAPITARVTLIATY